MRKNNKVFQQLVAQLLLSCFLLESCSTPNIQIQPKIDKISATHTKSKSVKVDAGALNNQLANNQSINSITGTVASSIKNELNQLVVAQGDVPVTARESTIQSIPSNNHQAIIGSRHKGYSSTSIAKSNRTTVLGNHQLDDEHTSAGRPKAAITKRIATPTPSHRHAKKALSLLQGQVCMAKGGYQVSFEQQKEGSLQAVVKYKYPVGFTRQVLPVKISSNLSCSGKAISNTAWQKRYIHVMKEVVYVGDMGVMGGMQGEEGSGETKQGDRIRKGLKLNASLERALLNQLPAGYVLGNAYDNGDCFFDALAKWLNIINHTDINDVKYLRVLCHEFYLENKELVDKWKQEEYGGIDQDKDEYYMVQYTADECEQNFYGRSPIWGSPWVEGQILCKKLILKNICVIEVLKDPETGHPVVSYHLVNQEEYKAISQGEAQTLIQAGDVPIIINVQDKLHFVPLLKSEWMDTEALSEKADLMHIDDPSGKGKKEYQNKRTSSNLISNNQTYSSQESRKIASSTSQRENTKKDKGKEKETEATMQEEEEILENKVERLLIDIDMFIEKYLENDKKNESIEKLIKKKLQKVKNSFDGLEVKESKQLDYFKYLYYNKNTAYLEVLGKQKKADIQKKQADRYKHSVRPVEEKKGNTSGLNLTHDKALSYLDNENQTNKNQTEKEVEKLLQVFANTINSKTLNDTKDGFKEINDHPLINFKEYSQLNDFESSFSDFVNGTLLRINELKGISEQKNKIDRLEGAIEGLKTIIKGRVLQIRLRFIEDMIVNPNLKDALFGDLLLTDKNIEKRFRELSLLFHPDKTDNWLPEIYRSKRNELCKSISACKDELLKEYEKEVGIMGKLDSHQNQGNNFWQIAMDYKRAVKGAWSELKMLKKGDIFHLNSTELEYERINNLEKAYEHYCECCKIADINKDLTNQIKFRGYIALCQHELKDATTAQLYALTAIKLIIQSPLATQKDLFEAEKIFNKVKGISNLKYSFKEHAENTNSLTPTRTNQNSLMTVAQTYSYSDKERIQNDLRQRIKSLTSELIMLNDEKRLMINSNNNRHLVLSKTSHNEILHARESSYRHKVAGAVVRTYGACTGGAVIGGTVIGSVGIATVAAVGGAILAMVVGAATIGLGIWGSVRLIKKGNHLLKEPTIREDLNTIIEGSINAYEAGKYQEFIDKLSEEYAPGSRILWLRKPGDNVNAPKIIKCLLQHGFRPDGIAYLLNLIGEALNSGKVKIPDMGPSDLEGKAKEAFTGTCDKVLAETAEAIDKKIYQITLGLRNKKWNQFQSEVLLNDNSKIAENYVQTHSRIIPEYIDDSQSFHIRSRLTEMVNIAKMNIAIIRILNGNEVEENLGINLIQEVQASINNNYQFVTKATRRLKALEDFLWVICQKSMTNNDHTTVKLIANIDDDVSCEQEITPGRYITYLYERIKIAQTEQEKIDLYNKIARFYTKRAEEKDVANHLQSLRDWKDAKDNYHQALQLNDKDYIAAMGFCKCLLKLSKYKEVLAFLRTHKNLANIADYWVKGSIAYRKLNDYKNAEAWIVQALAMDKDKKEAIKEHQLIKRLKSSNSKESLASYRKVKPKLEESYLNYRRSDESPFYKILSIDGGGTRGIIPAVWLSEIERKTRRPICHLFNMMSGPSTGGIITAGLSTPLIKAPAEWETVIMPNGATYTYERTPQELCTFRPRYTASDILELYTERAAQIFTPNHRFFPLPGFIREKFTTKYTHKGLQSLFEEKFGTTRLSETLTDLLIPAALENHLSETYYFDRREAKEDPFKDDTLVNVLRATTASPSFLPSYSIKGKGFFLDGGVHLNNSSEAAYRKAVGYGVPKEKIFVLSMGTGSYIPDPLNPDLYRGQLFWARNFHKVALAAQEGNTDIAMYERLQKNYRRWQAWLGDPIALDAHAEADISNLIEIGRQHIEELYASDDNTMNNLLEFLETDQEMGEF